MKTKVKTMKAESRRQVHWITQYLRRPPKCPGWKTAHESFTEELSHLV
jgi:hypothetical protein